MSTGKGSRRRPEDAKKIAANWPFRKKGSMKTYIVFDDAGVETETLIKAKSHNEAEKKAQKLYGPNATVAQTEV